VQFPNSKFADGARQKLLQVQEVLAESEFRVGSLYHNKGSFPAAANRFQGLADQFPLYSRADEALWDAADAYQRMGDRFENQQVTDLTRIVKDYPLSAYVDEAKEKLRAMNRPVPEADPAALARMQYELENRKKPGVFSNAFGVFSQHPDTRMAAKSGAPNMEGLKPGIPVSVPPATGTGAPGTNTVGAEVSAAVVTDTKTLDNSPDARANPPGQNAAAAGAVADTNTAAAQNQPLPSNHTVQQKPKKAKKNKKQQQQTAPDAAPASTTATPPAQQQ